jgi:arsenite methyltransferase
LDDLDFLTFEPDFSSQRTLAAYDELPLWSAMFGLLLLEEVPLRNALTVLDAGCGTGFPLIELAERLGPQALVHGIDPWTGGLERAAGKIASRATPNIRLHNGTASAMPFPDATFDLIVSNLGLNNFEDREGAIHECRRVARDESTLALTTNLQGHMRELYEVFEQVLQEESEDARRRLQEHIEHRATVAGVRELLEHGGFECKRIVEREGVMRFASGTALFQHHFIKLGFLDGWKSVVPGREREVFARLLDALNQVAARQGELRLTIPMAYIEAVAR